jgi:type IV pilus assembly protein PilB
MVGEVRDLETAEIAVKAALTGHLVLSTLHTNDAPSTISRLLNMGVEPFLVANSVNLICAQRLVRRVCSECKEETEVPAEALIALGVPEDQVGTFKTYHGEGCGNCNQSGYKGRTGLFEVMDMTPAIQEVILAGADTSEIRKVAMKEGMMTLRAVGVEKLRAGITTVEEVVRETAIH